MWLCLSDAFFSIVKPAGTKPGHLLVRARRPDDIERVFHVPKSRVTRTVGRDYLFRAEIPNRNVADIIAEQVLSINYGNFKDSVNDHGLHDAYFGVWRCMSAIQNPPPYAMRGAPERDLFDEDQEADE